MDIIKKTFIYKSGSTYNFNILLTANIKDLGFFDTLDDCELVGEKMYSDNPTGYTYVNSYNFSNYIGDNVFNSVYNVTGYSESRLKELEKYVVTANPYNKYFTTLNPSTDGLYSYISGSTGMTYIYYIGGIRYTDVISSGSSAITTSFLFTNTGFSSVNFENKRIIKYESKQNMVENPQVNSDVFIVRQQQTVFEKNYRLRGIGSLSDILSYAGGNYFTVFNNT